MAHFRQYFTIKSLKLKKIRINERDIKVLYGKTGKKEGNPWENTFILVRVGWLVDTPKCFQLLMPVEETFTPRANNSYITFADEVSPRMDSCSRDFYRLAPACHGEEEIP